MSPEKERPPARRRMEGVEQQEERTWMEFYPGVRRDATLAAEILAELDRDETLRRKHRGLYLTCQRSIRTNEARSVRAQRIGRFVRAACSMVFVAGPQSLMFVLRQVGRTALECLPEGRHEDSDRQMRRLLRHDAYAQADQTFRQRARRAADKSDSQVKASGDAQTASAEPKSAAG